MEGGNIVDLGTLGNVIVTWHYRSHQCMIEVKDGTFYWYIGDGSIYSVESTWARAWHTIHGVVDDMIADGEL